MKYSNVTRCFYLTINYISLLIVLLCPLIRHHSSTESSESYRWHCTGWSKSR